MVAIYGRDAPKMLLERAEIAEKYRRQSPGQGMAGDRGGGSAARPKPVNRYSGSGARRSRPADVWVRELRPAARARVSILPGAERCQEPVSDKRLNLLVRRMRPS